KTVRKIFTLYRQLGTVGRLMIELDRLGIKTKVRKLANGTQIGGIPFGRGPLYCLLANPIYVGEIPHKGTAYPGPPKGIIDRKHWDAVQAQLKENAVERRSPKNVKSPSLLAGLVYDETGRRLASTHGSRNGRRYHYYAGSLRVNEEGGPSPSIRLPAK